MSNEKTFICDNQKDERIFKIDETLLMFIVAGGLYLNFFVFASLAYLLFKSNLSIWIGGAFSLIVSAFISNSIRNWGLRRLEKMESKKIKDEMA
jgi:hypothetical protein